MAKYKKKTFKKKVFKRRARRRIPRALSLSETKLQKDIVDLDTYTAGVTGDFWTTPYQRSWVNPATFLNPDVVNISIPASCHPVVNLGSFIQNGNERNERNGRRITMMSSTIEMVMHIRAYSGATPPVYSYNLNPEFRIIQGWCKGGLLALDNLVNDITGMYSEIPYSKYKVLKDYILCRTGRAAMVGSDDTAYINPNAVLSYKPIKLKFRWTPNRKITFSNSSTNAVPNDGVTYAGWVPFCYVLNPHTNLSLTFDNLKRVNAFKDL